MENTIEEVELKGLNNYTKTQLYQAIEDSILWSKYDASKQYHSTLYRITSDISKQSGLNLTTNDITFIILRFLESLDYEEDCSYCKPDHEDYIYIDGIHYDKEFDMFVQNVSSNSWDEDTGDFEYGEEIVNYCPKCGRKLLKD